MGYRTSVNTMSIIIAFWVFGALLMGGSIWAGKSAAADLKTMKLETEERPWRYAAIWGVAAIFF